MGKIKNLAHSATEKAVGTVKDVKTYWNEPREGENGDGMSLGKDFLPLMKGEVNKKCELIFEPLS